MGIPLTATALAISRGMTLREVACEHCGTEFVYALAREAGGKATGIVFLGGEEREQAAAVAADANLAELLETDVDPVPCPKCSLYQSSMVTAIRDGSYWWVIGFAMLSALVGIIAAAVLMSAVLYNLASVPRAVFLVAMIGGIGGGLGLWWLHGRWCRAYDPNANEFAEQRRLNKHAVMLKSEVETEGPDRLLAPVRQSHLQGEVGDLKFNLCLRGVLFLGIAVTCLVFLFFMKDEIRYGIGSAQWPSTDATVVSVGHTTETETHKRRQITWYLPTVTYRFQIAGKEFTGSRYQFGAVKSKDPMTIQALLEGVTVNSKIDIHYLPSDPTVSVIVPGMSQSQVIWAVLLPVAAIVALIMFAIDVWRYRKNRDEILAGANDSPG